MASISREARVAYIFICACALNVPVLTTAQTDVVLSCDNEWEKYKVATLTCTILGTSYPSKCIAPSGRVNFRRSFGGSFFTTNCTVPDLTCTSSSPTAPGCACVSKSPNYILQYKFVADETYSDTWDCWIGCFIGSNYTLLITNGTCGKSIKEPPSDCKTVDCRAHCDRAGCIVIIVVFAVIIPIGTVIVICVCWKKKWLCFAKKEGK